MNLYWNLLLYNSAIICFNFYFINQSYYEKYLNDLVYSNIYNILLVFSLLILPIFNFKDLTINDASILLFLIIYIIKLIFSITTLNFNIIYYDANMYTNILNLSYLCYFMPIFFVIIFFCNYFILILCKIIEDIFKDIFKEQRILDNDNNIINV